MDMYVCFDRKQTINRCICFEEREFTDRSTLNGGMTPTGMSALKEGNGRVNLFWREGVDR